MLLQNAIAGFDLWAGTKESSESPLDSPLARSTGDAKAADQVATSHVHSAISAMLSRADFTFFAQRESRAAGSMHCAPIDGVISQQHWIGTRRGDRAPWLGRSSGSRLFTPAGFCSQLSSRAATQLQQVVPAFAAATVRNRPAPWAGAMDS